MRRLGFAVLPALAVLMVPDIAAARWSAEATGTAGAGATTMVNASGFSVTCNKGNGGVTLGWTISSSSFVTRYEIVRTGPDAATRSTIIVEDLATSSHPDSPGAPSAKNTTWTYSYTIRALSSTSWTTSPTAASTTVSLTKTACTTP